MNALSRSICRMIKVIMLTLLGFQFVTPAMASMREGTFTFRVPVSEAVLDSMRGGFQRGPDGPFMSFGIERNVFDNGKLISSTVLKIPDMARFADRRDWNPVADHTAMRSAADHPSETFTFIQSGPGNSFAHDTPSLPPFLTVIQNSLDNRTIQSETIINATVEALTWARSLHLGHALSQANISAIQH